MFPVVKRCFECRWCGGGGVVCRGDVPVKDIAELFEFVELFLFF